MNASSPPPDVLLLTMPFGVSIAPSIGLSLLKATLEREGLSARILYLNFRFAELIGMPTYQRITDEGAASDLIGEWIFARALNPDETRREAEQYVQDVLRKKSAIQARNVEGAPRCRNTLSPKCSARERRSKPFWRSVQSAYWPPARGSSVFPAAFNKTSPR